MTIYISPADFETSPTAARINAEKAAREAKWRQQARRLGGQRLARLSAPEPIMRAHVDAWEVWKAKPWGHSRNYVKWRCRQFGVAYRDVTGASRLPELVEVRDLLAFEIKHYVKPEISWTELSRMVGREYPAAALSVARVRASIGDKAAEESLSRERARINRYQASRRAAE